MTYAHFWCSCDLTLGGVQASFVFPPPTHLRLFALLHAVTRLPQISFIDDILPFEDVASLVPADEHRCLFLHPPPPHVANGRKPQIVVQKPIVSDVVGMALTAPAARYAHSSGNFRSAHYQKGWPGDSCWGSSHVVAGRARSLHWRTAPLGRSDAPARAKACVARWPAQVFQVPVLVGVNS